MNNKGFLNYNINPDILIDINKMEKFKNTAMNRINLLNNDVINDNIISDIYSLFSNTKEDLIVSEEMIKKYSLQNKVDKNMIRIFNYIKDKTLTQEYNILIDSRDINTDLYDNNKYVIHLKEEIKNIYEISLKSAIIPRTQLLINEYNNKISFKESNNTLLTVELTSGNYTLSELATEIQTQMNSEGTSNYTISTNDSKRITNVNDFNILSNSSSDNGENLFDGLYTTYWENTLGEMGSIVIELNKSYVISEYSILSYKSNDFPEDFTLSISYDKVNWIEIDSRTGESFTQYLYNDYSISSPALSAKYVKFEVTGSSSGTGLSITELELRMDTTDTIKFFSDLTGGDGIFTLNFTIDNTLNEMLGFDSIEYSGYNSYTSELSVNLDMNNKYINLIVNPNDFDVNNKDYIFNNIHLTSNFGEYTYINNTNNTELKKRLKKLKHLSKLNIEFRDKFNNLYTFNGYNHSLMLTFKYINIANFF